MTSATADFAHHCLFLGQSPVRALGLFGEAFIEAGLGNTYVYNEDDVPLFTLRSKYTRHDLHHESLARIWKECSVFREEHEGLIIGGRVRSDPINRTDMQFAGEDFWLTRTGAGAGFWDGDWFHGEVLTVACEAYGAPDFYVGDDGKIHYNDGK